MNTETALVFAGVVGARFVVPLFIPRYPLPAILACLVLDAVDQTIFQSLGFDPPGYQGYDKAMDVYYLAIAYIATLRNWVSPPAFAASRFLFFYRMVGVVVFELSQWRTLLLIFPNTFEYFFIAYEGVRTRWNPARFGARFWSLTATGIWIFIKLPQEWWIHIAKLDVTDLLGDVSWLGPALAAAAVLLLGGSWFWVRPRLPAPDSSWRLAAEPRPGFADTEELRTWRAEHLRVLSVPTFEKVVLVGLLSVIFAQVLPGVSSTNAQLFSGLGAIVVINTAITLWAARTSRSISSLAVTFVVRIALNAALVWLADALLSREQGGLDWLGAGFFVVLLSLLTTLHDRYQPIHEMRFSRGVGVRSPGSASERDRRPPHLDVVPVAGEHRPE